ncbi:hypothetical protein K470DRAFT_258205 [Piedraia hortae CBS 480.64]|uniref:Outer spore wall protein RRT8 n=1 Tax=Piedraia hortae CBS 480.64 TaxID=1314780 RepID=A0A6A7BYV7_9PEZI|nr:hypothetical protein K470DRAFT_258205 [Piedraia hortae CBS 480.64]
MADQKITEKVRQTAKEEAVHVRQLAEQGAKSGAYLYPLRGIVYLLSHEDLRRPLISRLASTFTLGMGVTTFMFLFTYVPQVAALVFTSGPLAALTTILLVLSESSTLTTVLSRALLIDESLIDTFDGTLVSKGETTLVAKERKVASGRTADSIARLGKLVKKPFQRFKPEAIVRYLMYLPLNFIPIIGTATFILLQGKKYGPQTHNRYFQLKGMSRSQREQYIQENQGAYTSFGVVATLLEMVPIAGIFFVFTNTCGAALWAADLEKRGGTAPRLRENIRDS